MKRNPNHPRSAKPLRLLVVDDSPSTRKLVTEACSELPIKLVGHARDGVSAIRMMRRNHPDVAILDLQMPKLGGLEVLKTIRAEELASIVIVFTSMPADPYRRKCRAAGADAFFEKPQDIRKLVKLLTTIQRPTTRQ